MSKDSLKKVVSTAAQPLKNARQKISDPNLSTWAKLGKAFGLMISVAALSVVLWFVYVGGYEMYRSLNDTRFPVYSAIIDQADSVAAMPEGQERINKSGILFTKTIYQQVLREKESIFGWHANDIMPTSWLDTASRQIGVKYATQMYTEFLGKNLSQFGKGDRENGNIKKAREEGFVVSSTKFWFPSAESGINKGIDQLDIYVKGLEKGDSIYNCTSSDLYAFFDYTTGQTLLGYALGLLVEDNDKVGFWDNDDRIEEAKGVALVVRDMVVLVDKLYPEIRQRNAGPNLDLAIERLNKVATFDPYVVLAGEHDSLMADHRGKVARYLMYARDRLDDVKSSLNR